MANVRQWAQRVGIADMCERMGVSAASVSRFAREERLSLDTRMRHRWDGDDLIEVVRMLGFVPFARQARFFKKKKRTEKSVKYLVRRVVKCEPCQVHGMSWDNARKIVHADTPRVCLPYQYIDQNGGKISIVLWCDVVENLQPGVPQYVRDAINACAMFQRWLFKSDNPKKEIKKMIKDRSAA